MTKEQVRCKQNARNVRPKKVTKRSHKPLETEPHKFRRGIAGMLAVFAGLFGSAPIGINTEVRSNRR